MLTLKRLLLTVSIFSLVTGCATKPSAPQHSSNSKWQPINGKEYTKVATSNAASMDDANAAYQRGDYAQVYMILRPLAAQGNVIAQYTLGML